MLAKYLFLLQRVFTFSPILLMVGRIQGLQIIAMTLTSKVKVKYT